MRKRNPDNRFRFVKECVLNATLPELPNEVILYEYLTTQTCSDSNIAYALEIYENPYEREIMNAFILSGATNEQINMHLKVSFTIADVYRHLFFDVTQFRDELDVFSWVREQEATLGEVHEVQLLKQAVLGGVDAMLWIYSRQSSELNPKEVLQDILADSYFRAKMHRGAPITSKASKEAHGYMATAIKAGDLLAKYNMNQPQQTTTNDLMIKLNHRDLTQPLSSVPNKDDILH